MPVLNGYKKWNRKVSGEGDLPEIKYPLPKEFKSLSRFRMFIESYTEGEEKSVWTGHLDTSFNWSEYEEQVGLPIQFLHRISAFSYLEPSEKDLDTFDNIVLDWKEQLDNSTKVQEEPSVSFTSPRISFASAFTRSGLHEDDEG